MAKDGGAQFRLVGEQQGDADGQPDETQDQQQAAAPMEQGAGVGPLSGRTVRGLRQGHAGTLPTIHCYRVSTEGRPCRADCSRDGCRIG